jgi:hypothetical protein
MFKSTVQDELFRPKRALVLFDNDQWLIEFNRMPVLYQDGSDGTAAIGFDLVEHFHRFDYADNIAGFDLLADFHKRRSFRGGRAVKGTDHG